MDASDSFDVVLSRARGGSEEAIGHLHAAVHPSLVRYLAAYEPAIAEELANDVWLGVALGLRRYAGGSSRFRTWVFAVARRRLQQIQAEPGSRRAFVADRAVTPSAYGPRDGTDEPASQLALRAIAALHADARDVLVLRTQARLSRGEVGRVLHLRPRAVEQLERRAVASLAASLAEAPLPA
jgi:RNA polymerase sigma factor (sigma-70 family)